MKNWDISGWSYQTDLAQVSCTGGLITQEPLHVMYCCQKMIKPIPIFLGASQNIIEYFTLHKSIQFNGGHMYN